MNGDLAGFDGDLRELLLGRAVVGHAAAAHEGPERRPGHADADLAQILGIGRLLDARGLDEPLRHLLAADHEHDVVHPARDQHVAAVERVAARGAAGGEVVDGDAGGAHLVDDVVAVEPPAAAAREARAGGGDGLDVAPCDARVLQRRLDGMAAELRDGLVLELAPGMHPEADDGDVSHGITSPPGGTSR